jgi:hypothetical protein
VTSQACGQQLDSHHDKRVPGQGHMRPLDLRAGTSNTSNQKTAFGSRRKNRSRTSLLGSLSLQSDRSGESSVFPDSSWIAGHSQIGHARMMRV